MSTETSTEPKEVYLEADKDIPGQHYVCMSFLSPEKVLANKDVFMFSEFVKDYEVQYKIKSTETFLMNEMKRLQDALSKATDILEVAMTKRRSGADGSFKPLVDASGAVVDPSGSILDASGSIVDASGATPLQYVTLEDISGAIQSIRELRFNTTNTLTTDLESHIKTNMADIKITTIHDDYDSFLHKNRSKLEEDFFSKNSFRTTMRGLKIRGVFDTYAEAVGRAKTLQRLDPYFNVFVGQVGFWLPWDPDPNNIKDQEYADEQLNQLMKRYKENESQRDEFYEQMKRERVGAAKSSKPVFGTGAGAGAAAGAAASGADDATISHTSGMFAGEDLAIARKRAAADAKKTE